MQVATAWIVRGDEVLLEAPDAENPLRGRWELPSVVVDATAQADRALTEALHDRHGLALRVGNWLGSARHGVMHRRLAIDIFRCALRSRRAEPDATRARWFEIGALRSAAVNVWFEKIFYGLRALLTHLGARVRYGEIMSSESTIVSRLPDRWGST